MSCNSPLTCLLEIYFEIKLNIPIVASCHVTSESFCRNMSHTLRTLSFYLKLRLCGLYKCNTRRAQSKTRRSERLCELVVTRLKNFCSSIFSKKNFLKPPNWRKVPLNLDRIGVWSNWKGQIIVFFNFNFIYNISCYKTDIL